MGDDDDNIAAEEEEEEEKRWDRPREGVQRAGAWRTRKTTGGDETPDETPKEGQTTKAREGTRGAGGNETPETV